MSKMSYQHVMKISRGHSKFDLNTMSTAVELLKFNPTLDAKALCSILADALPSHTNIDNKFIDNFRRRVAIYLAKNPNSNVVSNKDGRDLASSKDINSSDFIGMNDPLVKTNLNKLYEMNELTD